MMNIEVIIVGGGLSGLYAARLLEKAGINYLLLEGRERMGGRILQANTVEADLGATWFWPTIQPALKQLFRELNIESFSHQERGDMLFERSKDAPSRHPGFVSSPAAARVSRMPMDVRLAGRRNMYCWHCPPCWLQGSIFSPRCPRRYCRHGVTPEPGWPPMQSMSLCIPIIFGTGRDYPER